jgi:transcriptional regulator with XRE-family HTH domain
VAERLTPVKTFGVRMGRTGTITEHERIRRLRRLLVTEQASRTGFSHGYVSMVESGKIRPSARYRAAAAKALDVPESILFPGTDDV